VLAAEFWFGNTENCDRGLNPTAELGQLGQEEQEWLIPWLQQERCDRPQLQLDGPIPPDSMWVRPSQAVRFGWRFSCPRCLSSPYHDQGLIPVKQRALTGLLIPPLVFPSSALHRITGRL